MRLPRVMHVIDSLYLGGAERIAFDLTKHLSSDVTLCVTRQRRREEPVFEPTGRVLLLGRQKTWDPVALASLIRYCRDHAIDILHAHSRSTLKLCALVKVVGRLRCRVILHDHFGDIRVDRRSTLATRVLFRRCIDKYIGVTPELQEWAITHVGLPPEATAVLENGIERHIFQTAEPLPRRDVAVFEQQVLGIVVANLKAQKDHELLLRAMARSTTAASRLHVVVVGRDLNDEYSRRCRQAVVGLGLSRNVTFLGCRTDVPRLLRTADIGLLSSQSESGPLVLLEYMAAGLPFVATRTGQVADDAAASGLPYLVAPGDERAYADALDALIAMSPADRSALIAAGRQFVSRYDIGRQALKLEALYADMLREARHHL